MADWFRLIFLARQGEASGWRLEDREGTTVLFLVADDQLLALLRRIPTEEPPIGGSPSLNCEMLKFLRLLTRAERERGQCPAGRGEPGCREDGDREP